jgi:hypothetical protein
MNGQGKAENLNKRVGKEAMSYPLKFVRMIRMPDDGKWLKAICLLALVLLMVLFIKNAKDYGVFCGAVAILYAIIDGKQSIKK